MKTKRRKMLTEPWIWLQENEASGHASDCKCRLDAEYRKLGDNGSPAFFMCPLHVASPALLSAAKRVIARWEKNDLAEAVTRLGVLLLKLENPLTPPLSGARDKVKGGD